MAAQDVTSAEEMIKRIASSIINPDIEKIANLYPNDRLAKMIDELKPKI